MVQWLYFPHTASTIGASKLRWFLTLTERLQFRVIQKAIKRRAAPLHDQLDRTGAGVDRLDEGFIPRAGCHIAQRGTDQRAGRVRRRYSDTASAVAGNVARLNLRLLLYVGSSLRHTLPRGSSARENARRWFLFLNDLLTGNGKQFIKVVSY
jgi:hypothetical protein